MWVVKAVYASFRDGVPFRGSYIVFHKELYNVGFYSVDLYETSTKQRLSETIHSDYDVVRIKQRYSPYGLCRDGNEYLCMEIDDTSLQFLDYIKSVVHMRINSAHPVYKLVTSRLPTFKSLESYNTLFMTRQPGEATLVPSTLLQAVSMYKLDFLVNNSLYLVCMKKPSDISFINSYRVDFTDTKLAMRYVTKSIVTGLNKPRVYANGKSE